MDRTFANICKKTSHSQYRVWNLLQCTANLSITVIFRYQSAWHTSKVSRTRFWYCQFFGTVNVVTAATLQSFKKHLKTFLLQRSYSLAV